MNEPPVKRGKFQFKKKFYQPNSKQYLEVGHRGFLATCNFDEKDCVRECYNILNHYANELYGVEDGLQHDPNNQDVGNTDDIADELRKQIDAAQVKRNAIAKRRFQAVDTGAPNCIFIKTILDDPRVIAERILDDIVETKQQKTRHLLRLVPINTVCKANHEDIVNTAGQLCDKYFLKDHVTFSVVVNKRFNNDVDRQHLIHEIADLIHAKNVKNKVDLKRAKRSLIIEIIKGLCCLSVVDNYMAMKKYNLVELARADKDLNKKDTITKEGNSEKDAKASESCEVEDKTTEAKIESIVSHTNEV